MRSGRPEARGWVVRWARLLLFGAMPWFARGALRTGAGVSTVLGGLMGVGLVFGGGGVGGVGTVGQRVKGADLA